MDKNNLTKSEPLLSSKFLEADPDHRGKKRLVFSGTKGRQKLAG
jgi:hypothetical protein